LDGAGTLVPGDPRGVAARSEHSAAPRAARPRVVGQRLGEPASLASWPPMGALDLSRDRHGGRTAVSSGRRLLAVNFRDPAHPEAGGAELHLEWILREAVGRGFEVTWLASGFVSGAPEAEHGGMRIVRRGD